MYFFSLVTELYSYILDILCCCESTLAGESSAQCECLSMNNSFHLLFSSSYIPNSPTILSPFIYSKHCPSIFHLLCTSQHLSPRTLSKKLHIITLSFHTDVFEAFITPIRLHHQHLISSLVSRGWELHVKQNKHT